MSPNADQPSSDAAKSKTSTKNDEIPTNSPSKPADQDQVITNADDKYKKFDNVTDQCTHAAKKAAVRATLCVVGACFCVSNAFRRRRQVPPVTDHLLVDGAVTLASKIRNGEVL